MRVPPPYDRNRSAGGTRRERTCIADEARPPNFANTLGLPGAIQVIAFEREGFLTQKSGSGRAHTDTIHI